MNQLFQKVSSSLKRNPNNIFLILLPFLLLYGILVISGMKEGLRKDEWRYVYYAHQLLKGEYSPPGTVFLWNGPGYPLFLAPFIAMGFSLGVLKMFNAFFLYLSLVYFYKSSAYFFPGYISLVVTALLGAYWPAYEMLSYLMTESFMIFLITLLLWFCIRLYMSSNPSSLYMMLLAGSLALAALTKVIFGYVLLAMILIMSVWLLIKRNSKLVTAVKVILLSLVFCWPYLIYTYTISGKLFYWSNAGGMQLYWMSTPYKGEFGDWINFTYPVSKHEEVNKIFSSRHGKIINELFDYPHLFEKLGQEDLITRSNIYQDEGFRKYAWANIKSDPGKFLNNWVANVSRMLFDIPYSYKTQNYKFLKYAIPHIPLLAALLLGFAILVSARPRLPFPIIFLMIFTVVYLGGSSLLSAYPRQFYITIPILTFWIAMTLAPVMKTRKVQ